MKRAKPQSEIAQRMAAEIEAAEGKIKLPHRFTREGIRERREHVWRLYARRVPQTVIAQLLHVSRRTIASDVAWWHEQNRQKVDSIKNDVQTAYADIGDCAHRLQGIAAAAMNDYELARTAQMKNLFLNTATRAELAYIKLMIETGTYPHRQEDVRVTHTSKVTFESKLGEEDPRKALDNPVSRRKVLEVVQRLLQAGSDIKQQRLLETTKDDGDVIDITPAQVENNDEGAQ